MMQMGGMGGMAALPQIGGMKSLDMDGMMSKMMSGMGSMDLGSSSMSSTSMQSSSFSSSSSSSSTMMSSEMGSLMGGMGMPPMRGMEMPGLSMQMPSGLSFEEMPSMPPTASTVDAKPEYTVTSPPPGRAEDEMTHSVKQTDDYKPMNKDTSNDSTVLLKLKGGSDYKLVLNMQQYAPEEISIKLNGNELLVEASHSGEEFKQKHIIPEHIDLDLMSSSFSSDGILVIKAPKRA